LESNISKEVLPLNQPISPLLSPLKKEEETNFSSELFYGPSFFHKGTKTRKFACDEKTKKKLYLLSVQLCLVRCEKNPEPRFSRERIKKKKKKSGHPFPSKKSTSLAFFPE
jgi:hypothetical protein